MSRGSVKIGNMSLHVCKYSEREMLIDSDQQLVSVHGTASSSASSSSLIANFTIAKEHRRSPSSKQQHHAQKKSTSPSSPQRKLQANNRQNDSVSTSSTTATTTPTSNNNNNNNNNSSTASNETRERLDKQRILLDNMPAHIDDDYLELYLEYLSGEVSVERFDLSTELKNVMMVTFVQPIGWFENKILFLLFSFFCIFIFICICI